MLLTMRLARLHCHRITRAAKRHLKSYSITLMQRIPLLGLPTMVLY